jgi:hypothetical protein
VASDHRDDYGAAKILKLVVTHLQGRPHLAQGLVTTFLRQQRQIPTELGKRKRLVQLIWRAVSLIDEGLRVGNNRFSKGSHRFPPSGESEPLIIRSICSDNMIITVFSGKIALIIDDA